ncbi:MAG: hypothetical protein WCW14_01630 [Candidatus Paceibacterota bacterium]|jgi:hypothetical protein
MKQELQKQIKKTHGGFGLVEIIIASALILLIFTGIVKAFSFFVDSGLNNTEYIQSSALLEEGIEAVKIFRDHGWSTNIASLSTTTTYYLVFNENISRFLATTTYMLIDGNFDRNFTIANVYRDASKNISPTGTLDEGARLVTMNVSWSSKGTTLTRTIQAYIFNIFGN